MRTALLRALLCPAAIICPVASHAEWYEASSKHFVVYSEDAPDRLKAFTERLERFDKAIRVFRQSGDDKRGPASRVTVYVVDSLDDIRRLYGPGGGSVAGFYNARASGSVAFTPRRISSGGEYGFNPQAVLFHEYGHHWQLTTWSDAALPAWFVEGFAEFHATAQMRLDGSVVFGAAPVYRQFTGMNMNLLPARQLLRPNPGKLEGPSIDALYSRGWLLTHYLTFDEGRRKQLADYLVAINSGKPIDDAIALLGDPDSLDFKLNAYAKRASLPSVTISKAELPVGEITLRHLTPGEQATMPARIVSTRGVDKKNAPIVAVLARKLAAPFPNDAGAQNVLAEAEYDAAGALEGDKAIAGYAAAEAAADLAIAADPKSVHAYIYKGKARLGAAAARKSTDPAVWTEARRPLLAANKLDPEDPSPLYEYYSSYAEAKQAPTKGAESGLIYAYALAPYDLGLRLAAGKLFLKQNNVAAARTAITPVAYYRDGGMSTLGQKVLAALDKGGAEAAINVMEEKPKEDDGDKGDGKKQ